MKPAEAKSKPPGLQMRQDSRGLLSGPDCQKLPNLPARTVVPAPMHT